MSERPRVAVIGGGIAGLSAASFLLDARAGAQPRVTLLEADHRLGGKIRTDRLAGMPVEMGPDGFLARPPETAELCRSLGLEKELVAPTPGPAYLWSRNRLRPIPAGLVMGLPMRLGPLLRSGILSPPGILRAGLDLILPRRSAPTADVSVGDLVRTRFGSEVLERLVDPLLAGIYAGRATELSLLATMPELAALARRDRSLLLALRSNRPTTAPASARPSFLTLTTGLESLVDSLRRGLTGVEVRTGVSATRLAAAPEGSYRIELTRGDAVESDAVILAVPAFAAANLVRGESPVAARELDAIAYASVATVALAYPAQALLASLAGTGFLVPRHEQLLLVGCTWLSTKWPHLADGQLLLRCAIGRAGDEHWKQFDDAALTARVHADLVRTMGLRRPPADVRVTRWEKAIPQYTVGHLERLRRIEEALAQLPGVVLTGSAYRGVGVTGCIAQAKAAASQTLAWLRSRRVEAT